MGENEGYVSFPVLLRVPLVDLGRILPIWPDRMEMVINYQIKAQLLSIFCNKSLQRPGIEPGPPAWQARILPLNQRCLWPIFKSVDT